MFLKALLLPLVALAGGFGILHVAVLLESYLLLATAIALLLGGALLLIRPRGTPFAA